MKNEKFAIYCRIDKGGSKEAQEKAIQIQRFKLEQYIKNNKLHLHDIYEDMGHVGNDMNRAGLKKLLTDYNAGKFKFVLVTNTDRLFRGLAQKKDLFPFCIKSIDSIE